jgi:hypothetical protein
MTTIPAIASGNYETPYIYAKNYVQIQSSSAPITGPSGVFDDEIRSDGDSDFFARRALGVVNFNDENGNAFISGIGPAVSGAFPISSLDYPLAPEKFYRRGAGIPIQVLEVNGIFGQTLPSPTYVVGGVTYSASIGQALFQGVKRFKGVPNCDPGYKFYEKPFSYVLPVNINWTYLAPPYSTMQVADPKTFYKQVNDFDFELWGLEIGLTQLSGGNNGFMVMIYDTNGNKLMSDFVYYGYLALNGTLGPGVTAGVFGGFESWINNCFPVPPVVFEKGSTIRVDIVSLGDTATGNTGQVYINFRGVRRIPC